MTIKSVKMSAITFAIAITISGCNDDDDNTDTTPTVQTGVFIDAPVKGLGYQTDSENGTTNAAGEFKYLDGESVTFYLDGFELGSAPGAANLPVTMLPNTPDIARVLQTLDSDADENLIDVSDATLTDEQKAAIQAVFDNEKHISEIGLENLAKQNTVGTHVLKQVGSQKWSEDLVSGKSFEDTYKGGSVLIKFDSDYTGTFTDTEGDEVMTAPTSWGLDADKDTLNLTLITDDGNEIIQMTLLGQQENGTLDLAMPDEDGGDFIVELVPVTE